jgi:hypothetical protein
VQPASFYSFSQLLSEKKKNPENRLIAGFSGFTAGSRDRTDTPYWGVHETSASRIFTAFIF